VFLKRTGFASDAACSFVIGRSKRTLKFLLFAAILAVINCSSVYMTCMSNCTTDSSMSYNADGGCGPLIKHTYVGSPCVVVTNKYSYGDGYLCHYAPKSFSMSFPMVIDTDSGDLTAVQLVNVPLPTVVEVTKDISAPKISIPSSVFQFPLISL